MAKAKMTRGPKVKGDDGNPPKNYKKDAKSGGDDKKKPFPFKKKK